ncbi:ferric reductase-like transmembrane domain-containing protein [Streptomyces sp. NPDC007264]|uniref:ferric reductase-like transmembrane domain-containing protein n=1 Tax=Streptomyces sp. NPDC007264 TaxID=3364777 RepID=UPI0036D7D468
MTTMTLTTPSLALPYEVSFDGPGLWYATRATGLVALLLLTLCVTLGVLTTVRFASPKWPRFVTVGLHNNTSLLTAVFLALHVLTTVVDSYTDIRPTDAFLPFAANYRPLWLGLGTVASDLLIALIVTSLVRVRMGHRGWRAIHWLAYVSWPVAVVHALGTGTDPATVWGAALVLVCLGAVLGASVWRLAAGWPERRGLRLAVATAVVAVVLAGWGWASSGPLAPGWSQRALAPVPPASAMGAS